MSKQDAITDWVHCPATLGNGDALPHFGRKDISQASAVIMQSRLQSLESLGISTEFHAYEGLPHGFGIGTGTIVEGWLNEAVAFWEAQCE